MRTSGVSYSSEKDEFLLQVSLESARLFMLNKRNPCSGFLTPSRSERMFCSLAMVSSSVCFGRSKTWMSSNLSFPFGSAGTKLERRLNTPHFQSRIMVVTMRKVGTVAYTAVSSMEEEVVVVGISR